MTEILLMTFSNDHVNVLPAFILQSLYLFTYKHHSARLPRNKHRNIVTWRDLRGCLVHPGLYPGLARPYCHM
jgi:hypothetical protein